MSHPSNTLASAQQHVIYEWLTSREFLLPQVLPEAAVIQATPTDTLDTVLERIAESTAFMHFHLNCTRTARFPECRAELVESLVQRGVQVLNARATDISKRALQDRCARLGLGTTSATKDGDPAEMIIVKTDLNFGGNSEWALSEEERSRIGAGTGSTDMYKPNHYSVLPRREVPERYWTDSTLVCERFVRNKADRWLRVFLLRERMVICELVDSSLIQKVGHSQVAASWTFNREALRDAPPAAPHAFAADVDRFATDFGLDFGAIDAMVDDSGAHFLVDVNTTPAYNYPIPGVIDYLRGTFAVV